MLLGCRSDKRPPGSNPLLPYCSQDNTSLPLIRAHFCLHNKLQGRWRQTASWEMGGGCAGTQRWGGYRQMDVWACAMVTWLNKTPYLLPHSIKFPEAVGRTRVLAWAGGDEGPEGGPGACPAAPRAGIWCKTNVKACLISPLKALITNKHKGGFWSSPGWRCWSSSNGKLLLEPTESSNNTVNQRASKTAPSSLALGFIIKSICLFHLIFLINSSNTSSKVCMSLMTNLWLSPINMQSI